jgi:hypothetical protein
MSVWTALDFLFHRYVRLAPTLYTATLLALLYGYVSTLPYARAAFYDTCADYWWLNFLFIENFFSMGHFADCYDSVWTISVEMQLYVLTLPVVYFFVWEKMYGYVAALCFAGGSFIIKVRTCVSFIPFATGLHPHVFTCARLPADSAPHPTPSNPISHIPTTMTPPGVLGAVDHERRPGHGHVQPVHIPRGTAPI